MTRPTPIVLVVALLACHGSAPAPAPAPAEAVVAASDTVPAVTLERTPCFGRCPVYRVTVARSGLVRWEGRRFVADSGLDSVTISAGAVDSLLAELARGGYYGFEGRYMSGAPACGLYATDLPTVVSSATDGRQSQRVEHDHGCTAAPRALAALEQRIDSVAGTARWIGR